MPNTHAEYQTTDILLAAFLRLNSCKLDRIIKDGDRGTFVFTDVSADLPTQYDLGQTLVEPISFHSMFRQLTASVRRL